MKPFNYRIYRKPGIPTDTPKTIAQDVGCRLDDVKTPQLEIMRLQATATEWGRYLRDGKKTPPYPFFDEGMTIF